MAGNEWVDPQRRAGWFIVVGLALAALSMGIAIFAIAASRENGGPTSQAPPTSTTVTTSNSPITSPSTRTSIANLPGPPTPTAQPPSTVTVTVPAPTVVAQPAPSGGRDNGTATTIAAVTALVGAVTGLVAAATGLVKVLRTRESAAVAPR